MRFLIISPDLDLNRMLQHKLAAAGLPEVVAEPAYPTPSHLGRLIREKRPEVVLVGLRDPDYARTLIEDLHARNPNILVAATHSVNVPELILGAIRSGATEYLGPPFDLEHLAQVAREHQDQLGSLKPTGRMITLLPAGGGCGASTVALHLAAAIGKQSNKRVLLFDWDLHSGTTAFRLRLKPELTLADALERNGPLDEFWGKLVCPWRGIDLLASVPAAAEGLGRIPTVLASAKRNYEWIVSDLPPAVQGGFEPVAMESDTIYVVCTPDLVSLHLARRRVEELRRLNVPDSNVKLIVNRDGSIPFKPEEIRNMVGIPVARTIPNDFRSLNAAWFEGRLASDGSDIGRVITKFAAELAGPVGQPEAGREKPASWRALPRFLRASACPTSLAPR